MGLAERFKDKLNNKDIFKKNQIEQDLEFNDIKFISKPITEDVTIQSKRIPAEIHKQINLKQENQIPSTIHVSKFEDMETEIINKIRKTPYWQEYSQERQLAMISTYFDKKTKTKYSNISFTGNEREDFIQNILTLANNR